MHRLRAAAWCAAVLVGFMAEAKDPVPPEDPALRARIEKCVQNLSSPKPEERKKAAAELEAIGEPAAYALYPASKGRDAETALVAQQLLRKINFIPPDVREWIAALRKTRKSSEWEALVGRIVAAGPAAKDLLAEELNTPYGKARISVEKSPEAMVRGKSAVIAARLHNDGREGFWIDPSCLQLYECAARAFSAGAVKGRESSNPFKDGIPDGGFGEQIQKAIEKAMQEAQGGSDDDEEIDMPPYVYVGPGDSYVRRIEIDAEKLDFVGEVRFQVQYVVTASHRNRQWGRLQRQQVEEESEIDLDSPLAGTPFQMSILGESDWGFVVPALQESSAHRLALRFAEGPKVSGKEIAIRLALKNQGRNTAIVPAADPRWSSGFWYALKDRQGKVVDLGRLDGQPNRGTSSQKTQLRSEQELEASGRIAPQVPAGTYALVCGFSCHDREVSLEQRIRQKESADEWVGNAVTAPVEVEIR